MQRARVSKTRIIVISLENAAERRSRFAARASDAGVEWSFFPARTELHPALEYQDARALAFKGRRLLQGELGCYSSHYAAWESLLADDAERYVVIEDDVIVDWAFMRKLLKVDLDALGIGYLRLYCQMPVNSTIRVQAFVDQSRSVVELFGFACGTQAYVIDKPTARRLMKHCRKVRAPIDNELDRSWSHGVPNLAIFPFPVLEESVPSGIGVDRYEEMHVPAFLRLRSIVNRKLTRWQIRALRLSSALGRLLGRSRVVNYLSMQRQGQFYLQANKPK